ncbi:MAG: oxidase, partial [Acidobacteria bacterium]
MASAANPLLSWATDAQIAIPGKKDLIVRSYRFFDLETPVESFRSWFTPAEHFFVRNHMHE